MKMKKLNINDYKYRVTIIKAMAHATRLFIIELLQNGSLCVCEINALIDADVSTVSKHLSILRNAGLVSSEKKGLQVYYSLEMPCVIEVFACIEAKNG